MVTSVDTSIPPHRRGLRLVACEDDLWNSPHFRGDLRDASTPHRSDLRCRRCGNTVNHTQTNSFSELLEEFTDNKIVELVFAASIFNWGNKFNITMTLDAEDSSQYPTGLEYPLEDPEDVKVSTTDD